MKNFKFFIGKETFSIVSCPIRDTSPWDFSIMTLVIHNVFHNLFTITVIQLKTLQLLTYVIHRKNGYLWHVIAYHLENSVSHAANIIFGVKFWHSFLFYSLKLFNLANTAKHGCLWRVIWCSCLPSRKWIKQRSEQV